MEKKPVLTIDKPDFTVKLFEDLIEVDLKEGAKKELEDVVEAHPALRESLGFLFQTVVPSDVELCEIQSVEVDDNGQLKLVIPRHRDIVIPLELDEARKLAKELNELIPLAKTKKAAFKRRFPLYSWWPDYYSHVIASDDLWCSVCSRTLKLPTKCEHRISFYMRVLYDGVVTLIRA